MRPARWVFLIAMVVMLSLSGCYTTPVKHLSADVALIQVGKTTEEDALVFLGQPDKSKELADGRTQWLYEAQRSSLMEKTPWVGEYFGSPSVQRVVLTFKNGIVSDIRFAESDQDDLGWSDDYSWQEKSE
jgi:hypothetical protein